MSKLASIILVGLMFISCSKEDENIENIVDVRIFDLVETFDCEGELTLRLILDRSEASEESLTINKISCSTGEVIDNGNITINSRVVYSNENNSNFEYATIAFLTLSEEEVDSYTNNN